MPNINIRSKGEIVEYVKALAAQGQVKECKNLMLDAVPAGWFYVICDKKFASEVPARNVTTSTTGYDGPSGYSWPRCPPTCARFEACDNFELSVSRDQHDEMEEMVREANRPDPQPAPMREVELVGKAVTYPEKVTLEWLWKHVPMKFWLWLAGILGAIALTCFAWGYHAANLPIVKQWQGTDQKEAPAATTKAATKK